MGITESVKNALDTVGCFVPEGNQYEKLRRFKKAPIWSLLASPQKRRHCWVAAFPEDFIC